MNLFKRSHGHTRPARHSGTTGGTGAGTHYDDESASGVPHDTKSHGGRFGRHSGRSQREGGRREKRPLFDINSGYYNRRPSFGTWLKYTWLDILTMIIMGAIGLGVYEADPAPSRSFPVTFSDGEIVYPQFAYPLRKEIIPIWAAALLGSLVPIFVILCMQIRIRSFWDVNNGVIGLLYSLIGAAVFQVFVKWLIGGLRPHFLDVCQPDVSRILAGGNGYQSLMFQSDICTGDRNQINDSLESMPSGHSTAAWAGFLYLYFYLNAKLKVFSNHHPAMWKLIALYAPLLGATLITGSLTIDEFHNWYDCLAGAIIGSVFAISAYRMVYASVWDFRFNHIPLTRHTPFSYGAGSAGAGGFESAVFTHKAGWGYEEAYGGAPFDSAFALRGSDGATGMTTHQHSHGLGDKTGGYRHGDVEHHAGTNTGITGVAGTHHRDHDHDHDHDHGRGLGHHHNQQQQQQQHFDHHHDPYNSSYHNNTGNTGNTTSGLAHHPPHNATGTREPHLPTHRGDDYARDGDLTAREGRTATVGGDDNNRYRSHRKSLERKAIGNQTQNQTQNQNVRGDTTY